MIEVVSRVLVSYFPFIHWACYIVCDVLWVCHVSIVEGTGCVLIPPTRKATYWSSLGMGAVELWVCSVQRHSVELSHSGLKLKSLHSS